jgi:hypothetical protein
MTISLLLALTSLNAAYGSGPSDGYFRALEETRQNIQSLIFIEDAEIVNVNNKNGTKKEYKRKALVHYKKNAFEGKGGIRRQSIKDDGPIDNVYLLFEEGGNNASVTEQEQVEPRWLFRLPDIAKEGKIIAEKKNNTQVLKLWHRYSKTVFPMAVIVIDEKSLPISYTTYDNKGGELDIFLITWSTIRGIQFPSEIHVTQHSKYNDVRIVIRYRGTIVNGEMPENIFK